MGFCEKIGRVVLVLINIIFSLVGAAMLIAGFIFRFGTDLLDQYLSDVYAAFEKSVREAGSEIQLNNLDITEILGDVSIAFIVIGFFFFLLGIFGCIGACCKVKILLIVYCVVLSLILVAEIVAVILLFTIKTKIDGWLQDPMVQTLQESYTGFDGADTVTIAWNFIMHEFECCGVHSYKDFEDAKSWDRTIEVGGETKNKTIPLTCCKVSNASDPECAINPTNETAFIDKGCYDAVEVWLNEHSDILIGVGSTVLAIEFILIIFAIITCCASRNKNDDEDDDYSENRPIHHRKSNDVMMGHNGPYSTHSGPVSPSAPIDEHRRHNAPMDGYGRNSNYPQQGPYVPASGPYTRPPEGYRKPYQGPYQGLRQSEEHGYQSHNGPQAGYSNGPQAGYRRPYQD